METDVSGWSDYHRKGPLWSAERPGDDRTWDLGDLRGPWDGPPTAEQDTLDPNRAEPDVASDLGGAFGDIQKLLEAASQSWDSIFGSQQ